MQDPASDPVFQRPSPECSEQHHPAPERKPGVYKDYMTPEKQEILERIESAGGLAWEIGILRPRVAAVLNDPDAKLNDILLITRAFVELLRADKKMEPSRWKGN